MKPPRVPDRWRPLGEHEGFRLYYAPEHGGILVAVHAATDNRTSMPLPVVVRGERVPEVLREAYRRHAS